MLRVAQSGPTLPWQRLAQERLEVANRLARICVVLGVVMILLGINSFNVMSEQSRLCSSLVQAHNSLDSYQARQLATTKIVTDFCG